LMRLAVEQGSGESVRQGAGSTAMLAGLAQKLGAILFKQGDKASAMAIFELSENLDPGSLLAKLHYARFLLHEANDPQAAASKAQALLALIEIAPFAETEDDFGSEQYGDAAHRLLAEAQSALQSRC
jgi:hypothetical protein